MSRVTGRSTVGGRHDAKLRDRFLGRAKQLLVRNRPAPPVVTERPAHLPPAPRKGGNVADRLAELAQLADLKVYLARPARTYPDAVPGSIATERLNRRHADDRIVQRWALQAAASTDLVLFRDRKTAQRHRRLLGGGPVPVLLTLRVGRFSTLGPRLSRFQIANGNVVIA